MLDSHKIQCALRYVHEHEKCGRNPKGVTRLNATLAVLRKIELALDERAILFSALALTEREREACSKPF